MAYLTKLTVKIQKKKLVKTLIRITQKVSYRDRNHICTLTQFIIKKKIQHSQDELGILTVDQLFHYQLLGRKYSSAV